MKKLPKITFYVISKWIQSFSVCKLPKSSLPLIWKMSEVAFDISEEPLPAVDVIYAAYDDDGWYFSNVIRRGWISEYGHPIFNHTYLYAGFRVYCARGPSIDKGTMIFYVWCNLLCVVGIGFGGCQFAIFTIELRFETILISPWNLWCKCRRGTELNVGFHRRGEFYICKL